MLPTLIATAKELAASNPHHQVVSSTGLAPPQFANLSVPRKRKNQEEDDNILLIKKLRRRERCRVAAARCRGRKREEVKGLEGEVEELQGTVDGMRAEMDGLRERLVILRAEWERHNECRGEDSQSRPQKGVIVGKPRPRRGKAANNA
jgi:hypothetical protein